MYSYHRVFVYSASPSQWVAKSFRNFLFTSSPPPTVAYGAAVNPKLSAYLMTLNVGTNAQTHVSIRCVCSTSKPIDCTYPWRCSHGKASRAARRLVRPYSLSISNHYLFGLTSPLLYLAVLLPLSWLVLAFAWSAGMWLFIYLSFLSHIIHCHCLTSKSPEKSASGHPFRPTKLHCFKWKAANFLSNFRLENIFLKSTFIS